MDNGKRYHELFSPSHFSVLVGHVLFFIELGFQNLNLNRPLNVRSRTTYCPFLNGTSTSTR
jgi:hypothetical protein